MIGAYLFAILVLGSLLEDALAGLLRKEGRHDDLAEFRG